MNTLEELIGMGLSERQAKIMLDAYAAHMGEMHGCNKVTDITYVGKGVRDIELTCTKCGAVYHRKFANGASKWAELRRTCECQTAARKETDEKRAIRNDDPSYIGKVYGDYKVLETYYNKHKNKSGGTVMWVCKCEHCGNVIREVPAVIKNGKRCQCQIAAANKDHWSGEIGKRYGRLTVVGVEHRKTGKWSKAYAVCNCDCGGRISVQFSALRAGQTKSCGCIQEEFIQKARDGRSEARSKSPLYSTWSGMKYRCFNEKSAGYKDYGGRGITVCDEWLGPEGFDRFEKWSYENGYRPESGLSLDRIDVNGNYEPSNCRYATVFVQTVNQRPAKRRPVKTYVVDGEEKTLKQWCKEYNISTVAVKYRMKTLGMGLEEALKAPKTRKGNIYAGQQAIERRKDVNKCDSYIEVNLYLAFLRNVSKYVIVPQYAVGGYRADFWIKGTDILIECDGYDYHKTREQIASDYERERFFTENGYRVIRFAGSEINKDPDKCCDEIVTIVDALYGKICKSVG